MNQEPHYTVDVATLIPRLAHEFRTPLNAISGYAQLAASSIQDEEAQDCIKHILAASETLNETIDDFIALFSEKFSQYGFDIAPHSLNDIVLAAKSMVQPQADKSQIEIITGAAITEIVIQCDPKRLKRVLINLLSNAVKYNAPYGHVMIDVKQYDKIIELTIEDSGIGIPEDELTSIFSPFYRASNAQSQQGNGLGLYTCKLIIEKMAGEIEVSSQLGKGTVFKILFNTA